MFMFLKTDSFDNKEKTDTVKAESVQGTNSPIRRPYRGIQIKDDTYSTISVRRPDGSPIPLVSSSDLEGNSRDGKVGLVTEYADYILQSVEDQRTEKQQILETFGDPFVYFFGERPRIVSFSGLLINTEDFNWRAQFWKNYDAFFRGTRLVQSNARCYLSYDTVVIEGYPLSASAVDDQATPYSVPFSIQMLVTNYYDWSNIGQTRFPAGTTEEPKSLDVLNQELMESRATFVSTGQEVRQLNLEASQAGGGLLSSLRKGIQYVNKGISFVSDVTKSIHDVVGGRVVRVPIGVAGFLQQQGAPIVASGSITSSAFGPTQGGLAEFDAATSDIEGLRGSVKLQVPAHTAYAPSWVSDITDTPKGYIFENWDEYATRDQAETLQAMLSPEDHAAAEERRWGRLAEVEKNQALLLEHNIAAEAGSFLGDLAEWVDFSKSLFGIGMTAAAFINDPLSVAKASLGIGIGTQSFSRIHPGRYTDPDNPSATMESRGIKTQTQETAAGGLGGALGKYVGFTAAATFQNIKEGTAQEAATSEDIDLGSQGQVYEDVAYASEQEAVTGAAEGSGTKGLDPEDKDYEAVYGDKDYQDLLDQQQEAAAEEQQEQNAAAEVQETLDEVYGNNDSAPNGSDVDPASIEEVYGSGSVSSSTRSPEEIAAALAAAGRELGQNLAGTTEEDILGITGVDDDGAGIDPVV
jgi:hypothetical protein